MLTFNCRDPGHYDKEIQYWDYYECTIKCIIDGSDLFFEGFKWNSDICDFDCVNPCQENEIQDQITCSCSCGLKNSNCSAPQTVDETCKCSCPSHLFDESCFNNELKMWNDESCSCECIYEPDCPDWSVFYFDGALFYFIF